MSTSLTKQELSLTGKVVAGRYTVGNLINRSSHSEVYEAHRQDMDQRIALRVTAGRSHAAGMVDRFVTTVQRAARIEHPCVNPVFDVGVLPDGRGFAAMQFADGEPMETLLAQQGGRLDPARAMAILGQLAGALGAAHRLGMVHGRLSMKRIQVDTHRGGRDTVTLLGFAAPDPNSGDSPQTPADDVFALGAIFWQLLTGLVWVPSSASTPSWPTRTGHIAPAVRSLVARMLSEDLSERPANGSAVIGSLQLAEAELVNTGRRRTALTPTDPPRLATSGNRRELRETPHKQVSQPRLQTFAQTEKGERPEATEGPKAGDGFARARRVTPVHARPRAQRPIARGNMIRPNGRSATALVSAAGPSGIIATVLASGSDLVIGATVHLTLPAPGEPFTLSARIVKVGSDGPRGPLVLTLVLDPRDEDYPRYAATYPRWQKS